MQEKIEVLSKKSCIFIIQKYRVYIARAAGWLIR